MASPNDDDDDLYAAINDTALMLRGMCFDPRIPNDTKDAMRSRYTMLESVAQQLYDRMMDDGPAAADGKG